MIAGAFLLSFAPNLFYLQKQKGLNPSRVSRKIVASDLKTEKRVWFFLKQDCNFHVISISSCSSAGFGRREIGRIRADVKSEPYDIADSASESMKFPDAMSDVVMTEGSLKGVVPWWEQFPKRWLIVILCFSAFLLCNMDRVNMSIAILPMSSEFNWNPATVGLIQSSFFWGYLLTQGDPLLPERNCGIL